MNDEFSVSFKLSAVPTKTQDLAMHLDGGCINGVHIKLLLNSRKEMNTVVAAISVGRQPEQAANSSTRIGGRVSDNCDGRPKSTCVVVDGTRIRGTVAMSVNGAGLGLQ